MRVAILGAGYAGLTVARRLERALPDEVELVVVDEHDYHLVQHQLHRVIRFPTYAEEIQVPLSAVLDRVAVRRARVESVDPREGVARLSDGDLDYDYAAICLGAETAFYDLPGVEAHATPLKRLEDAYAIREGFLALDSGRVVVGGAGLSGIQVAGELAALRDAQGKSVEVCLLEQEADVAPNFPANFREAVREELGDRGVVVRTDTGVTGADDATIHLESGDRLAYGQFVWTGGIRGPAALDGDRPTTRPDLRLADSTFVVGDAARVVDADGEAVPASAASAVREGRTVAASIASRVGHALDGAGGFAPHPKQFRFHSPGWVVSVGDGAVAQIGPAVLRGGAAKAAKASVSAAYFGELGDFGRARESLRELL
jgi:NADH dehydrogenase